jgi:hypothetical protein
LRDGAPGPDGEYIRKQGSPFAIFTPPSLDGGGPRESKRHRPDYGLLVIATIAALCLLWLGHAAWNATRVHVGMSGFDNHERLTQAEADALTVKLVFPSADQLDRATLTFDGRSIRDEATLTDTTVSWKPPSLSEGSHHLSVKVPRAVLPASVLGWGFVVDATAPKIDVPSYIVADSITAPASVSGHVDRTATLTVDGKRVKLTKGAFTLHFPTAPIGPVTLHAVDPAGNTTDTSVLFRPEYAPGKRGVHGVHVTAIAWANQALHDGIVSLIDRGLVDTVELDLKDEGGVIGYDSTLPEATAIGAVQSQYNLRDAVAYFKSRGVHVVGRIVAFRDPILAKASWDAGQKDKVIQDADGSPFSPASYGTASFVNYVNPEVQQYNIDIAKEAAAAGVDDILWDYIRRPEGDPSTMVVPGLTGTEKATWQEIVGFLRNAATQLRPLGVYEGASIFGISSVAPDSIGQRPAEMAQYLDYISPMVYPSAWTSGVLGVARPNSQPYDIVKASLAKFKEEVDPTGVAFVPWLQAFTLGVPYGPAELDAQIQAGHELGIDNFLLWNPNVTYGAVEGGLTARP